MKFMDEFSSKLNGVREVKEIFQTCDPSMCLVIGANIEVTRSGP